MEEFDTMKAAKAQADYCRKECIPNFAPGLDGKCYHCKLNICRPITHKDGRITGITVELAGKTLITGCPHCNFSFVE